MSGWGEGSKFLQGKVSKFIRGRLMQPHQLNTEIFIGRAKAIHGEKYDYSEVEYKNANTKVIIVCYMCGHRWGITPAHHMNGRGCRACQYKKLKQAFSKDHSWFLGRALEIHGDKYEYLSEYRGSNQPIKIRCKVCDRVYYQEVNSHLSGGKGCQQCFHRNLIRRQPMAISVFEGRCKQKHNNRYEYFGDFIGVRKKIRVLCKKHDYEFSQYAGNHLYGSHGCPKCDLSKGELEINRVLTEFGVEFVVEKAFPGCRDVHELAFDFFIPSRSLCIEYQGQQHYYPLDYFGGQEIFEGICRRDEIKREFCKQNGIDLLDIPYFEFNDIEKILKVEFGL